MNFYLMTCFYNRPNERLYEKNCTAVMDFASHLPSKLKWQDIGHPLFHNNLYTFYFIWVLQNGICSHPSVDFAENKSLVRA